MGIEYEGDSDSAKEFACRFSISIRCGIAEFFSPCAEILRRPDAGIEPDTESHKHLKSLRIQRPTMWRPCGAHPSAVSNPRRTVIFLGRAQRLPRTLLQLPALELDEYYAERLR